MGVLKGLFSLFSTSGGLDEFSFEIFKFNFGFSLGLSTVFLTFAFLLVPVLELAGSDCDGDDELEVRLKVASRLLALSEAWVEVIGVPNPGKTGIIPSV